MICTLKTKRKSNASWMDAKSTAASAAADTSRGTQEAVGDRWRYKDSQIDRQRYAYRARRRDRELEKCVKRENCSSSYALLSSFYSLPFPFSCSFSCFSSCSSP